MLHYYALRLVIIILIWFFFKKIKAGLSHQRDLAVGSTMLETMNSEYRQTESLDCPPRKLRILGKADGFSQDPDVVRLTLLIIYILCRVSSPRER